MYLLLTLFFISFLGIVFMIGRKLLLVKNGQIEIVEVEQEHPFVPDLQKMKNVTLVNVAKYGHLSLVTIIRLHVRSTNFLKNKYGEIKVQIKDRINRRKMVNGEMPSKQVSKFLKMISEYKHKIREIKHQIHREEEKNL